MTPPSFLTFLSSSLRFSPPLLTLYRSPSSPHLLSLHLPQINFIRSVEKYKTLSMSTLYPTFFRILYPMSQHDYQSINDFYIYDHLSSNRYPQSRYHFQRTSIEFQFVFFISIYSRISSRTWEKSDLEYRSYVSIDSYRDFIKSSIKKFIYVLSEFSWTTEDLFWFQSSNSIFKPIFLRKRLW